MSINEKVRNNNTMLDDDMDEEMEDTQEDKYLTFVLNREEYGIEIKHVIEIIGIQNITSVPDLPHYIKGVINLRGKVIPVMDVRIRFNINEQAYNERTCIIVITVNDQLVGLIVDEVSEVLDIPKANVEPSPRVNRGEGSKFVQGMGKVGDAVIILLNADKLLFEEDLEKIAAL
jgi:purine-binding chemotaxis protein CheW